MAEDFEAEAGKFAAEISGAKAMLADEIERGVGREAAAEDVMDKGERKRSDRLLVHAFGVSGEDRTEILGATGPDEAIAMGGELPGDIIADRDGAADAHDAAAQGFVKAERHGAEARRETGDPIRGFGADGRDDVDEEIEAAVGGEVDEFVVGREDGGIGRSPRFLEENGIRTT